jgi:4-amino-4-deoxy-L-arabinose transferase-like glycosyltransferase
LLFHLVGVESQLSALRLNHPPHLLALLVLANSLIHAVLGATLGLSGDEAHYALYAAHLDWSYYDHPPLVGWLQWPLVALGAADGVLRLVPVALWAVTALLVHALALRLHALLAPSAGTSEAAGLWAVTAFSLAPVLHVLGIGLLPDSLLMLLTAAVFLQTLRLLDAAELGRARAWLLLGALLGLAGLAKYTAIFAALPVLAVLLGAHGLRVLRQPWPWLGMLLALALVSPVFVWNAQHGWISFAYQLHHGAGSHWQAVNVLQFLLAQLLVYGPLLLWGGVALLRQGRRPLHGTPVLLGLFSFFALPFALLLYLSGGGSGLPHWMAPAWVALSPFAGMGLAALWAAGRRRALVIMAALQALLCVLLYALMLTAGPPWMSSREQPEAINPFTDFHGWDEAGERALQLARELDVSHLAVQNWTLASRLAWYARPLPVHVLDPAFDQFSLWSGDLPVGADALLMDWSQMAYQLPVGAGMFAHCAPADGFAVQRLGRPVSGFVFYHCRDWGGKPQPQRLGEP